MVLLFYYISWPRVYKGLIEVITGWLFHVTVTADIFLLELIR